MIAWHSPKHSRTPTKMWLKQYEQNYHNRIKQHINSKLTDPSLVDANIPIVSILQSVTWDDYHSIILSSLQSNNRQAAEYHTILDTAQLRLSTPWNTNKLDDIENRRLIGGYKPYGWLGHVGASGQFRKLLSNGTAKQKKRIVNSINKISLLNHPIPWHELQPALDQLVSTGPTMKVWSRALSLVRPDLFCTISSPPAQRNYSLAIGITQAKLITTDGYIKLLQRIHQTPWFNSARPTHPQEKIWERRVAFLDAVFY